jgi:hypothetical protein
VNVALVMSGGGARGAYEIGVLSVLIPELEQRGEKPSIVVGTSVGAFNAAFVAANAHRPAAEALEDGIRYWHELVWTDSLEPIGVLGEEPSRRRLLAQLLGVRRPRVHALLDAAPLEQTLQRVVDFDQLARNVAGGALEAAAEARDQGLVRFIGVTGHGLTIAAMHRRSLERFDFDSILLPYNYPMMQNPQYAADFEAVVAICRERDVAVQTIKAITLAPWVERPADAPTWYEPLREPADIDLAVAWVLGRPGLFLNTAGDIHLLPLVLDAAERVAERAGRRPSDAEMEELVERRSMAPLFA